jgi:hypothetical protein
MKVALLLYGQPRNIDNMKVINSHKNLIINKYDTDVFCHTYYSENGIYTINPNLKKEPIKCDRRNLDIINNEYKPHLKVFKYDEPLDKPDNYRFSLDKEKINPNKFNNEYDLKIANLIITLYDKCTIRKSNEFSIMNDLSITNNISQLYSINKVNKIFEEYSNKYDIKYDFIIVTRYDFIIDNLPPLDTLDSNYFYISNDHIFFPDTIYVFHPNFIKSQYTYENLDKILEKFLNDDRKIDYSYNDLKDFWDWSTECIKYNNYLLNYSNTLIKGIDILNHRCETIN